MITSAFVKIWGEVAGAIIWDERNGIASFEYDPDFRKLGYDLSPIKMPLYQEGRIFSFPELRAGRDAEYDTFKGLPGLIADALPDKYGNQLINAWLVRNGRPENSMNPVEKLCFIGQRGMGALEFEPTQFSGNQPSFSVEINSLVSVAQEMLSDRQDFDTNLKEDEQEAMMDILKIGTSAGGARPKAIIAYNPKTGEVRSGQSSAPIGFEHWLIKLDGVSDAQFGESSGWGRVEMAYYLMAKASGIDMMECELLEENGRAHFLTKRFDRTGNHTKHHMLTLCGMQHYDFNDMQSYSYEQIFQTMRILRLPYPQAEEMYRRMVFNIVGKNCDDHTKNFAFRLKQGSRWELSPAYDICYAYRPGSIWVSQHALSVNGKRKDFERSDLLTIANTMNIKKANHIIDEIIEAVKSWKVFAKEAGVGEELMHRINENLVIGL